MFGMGAVPTSKLAQWRTLDAVRVLNSLADHAKRDPTFVPTKDSSTSRWHLSVCGQDFELLVTGPKFWDCRAKIGGAGAVDLTMHLRGIRFRAATALLEQVGY